MNYRKEIGKIDQAIDKNRRDEKDAQARSVREVELFTRRGQLQLLRDEQESAKPTRIKKYVPRDKQLAAEVCFKSDTAIRWLRHAVEGIANASVKDQILTHCTMHEKLVAELRKEIA